jgi:hypothetical protein
MEDITITRSERTASSSNCVQIWSLKTKSEDSPEESSVPPVPQIYLAQKSLNVVLDLQAEARNLYR